MIRKTFCLTGEQMKAIKQLAERQHKSRSQVIRELIDLGRQYSPLVRKEAS
jgi:hypothetical protein